MYYIRIKEERINLDNVAHYVPMAVGGQDHAIKFYMTGAACDFEIEFGPKPKDKKERDRILARLDKITSIIDAV